MEIDRWSRRHLHFGSGMNQEVDHLSSKIWNIHQSFYLIRGTRRTSSFRES